LREVVGYALSSVATLDLLVNKELLPVKSGQGYKLLLKWRFEIDAVATSHFVQAILSSCSNMCTPTRVHKQASYTQKISMYVAYPRHYHHCQIPRGTDAQCSYCMQLVLQLKAKT